MKLSIKVSLTEEEIRTAFVQRIRDMVKDPAADVQIEWPDRPAKPQTVAAPIKESSAREEARRLFATCALTTEALAKATNGAVSSRTVREVLGYSKNTSDRYNKLVLEALKKAPKGPKRKKRHAKGSIGPYDLAKELELRNLTPYALAAQMGRSSASTLKNIERQGYCRAEVKAEIEAALRELDSKRAKSKQGRPQVGDVMQDGRTIKSVAQRSDGVWMYRLQSHEGHISLPLTEEELQELS